MTAIAFIDFWRGLPTDSMLHRAVRQLGVPLVIDPADASCVIHSDFGNAHRGFSGRRIHFSGENILPDFESCDGAITSANTSDERHYRLPYWAFACTDPAALLTSRDRRADDAMAVQQGFCSFVASNPRAPERNRFFRLLHRRKAVASAGRVFNTLGHCVRDKHEFLRAHRFTICFENTSSPGYTTEKLVDAFVARTIPIYWGNPEVALEFNPAAMVHAQRFPDLEALATAVLELDADPARRQHMLEQPVFTGNALPPVCSVDRLAEALDRMLAMPLAPRPLKAVSKRLRAHCYRSPLHQTAVSWACRLDALAWRMGWKRLG